MRALCKPSPASMSLRSPPRICLSARRRQPACLALRSAVRVVNIAADRELAPVRPSTPAVKTVPVVFQCALKVAFGEHLRVVGSHTVLGGWEAAAGPELTWSQGDVWTTTLELPAGARVEYKFVHIMPHSSPVWEATPNRSLTVPTARLTTIEAEWNHQSSGAAKLEAGAIEIKAPEARAFLETLELPVAFEQPLEGDSCPIHEYMESLFNSLTAEAGASKQAEAVRPPQTSAEPSIARAAKAAAADKEGKPASSSAAEAAATVPASKACAAPAAPIPAAPEKPALAEASSLAQLATGLAPAQVALVPAIAPAKLMGESGNGVAAVLKPVAEHAEAITAQEEASSAAMTVAQAAQAAKPASLAVPTVAEPATAEIVAAGEKAATPTASVTPGSEASPAPRVSARTSPLKGGEGAVAQAERRRKAQGESRRRAAAGDGGVALKARKTSSSGSSKQTRRKR